MEAARLYTTRQEAQLKIQINNGAARQLDGRQNLRIQNAAPAKKPRDAPLIDLEEVFDALRQVLGCFMRKESNCLGNSTEKTTRR